MPANARGVKILDEVTTTQTSLSYELNTEKRSWQVTGQTTSGAGSATVIFEVSNSSDTNTFMELGTITITLSTTTTSDAFVACTPFKYTRARVSALSGTGAAVSVYTGFWPS